MAQRKSFIKSFVKRIEIDGINVVVRYKLPLPDGKKDYIDIVVLPIDTFGGAEGIRTPDLLRAREALSQLSYSPIPDIIAMLGACSQFTGEYFKTDS